MIHRRHLLLGAAASAGALGLASLTAGARQGQSAPEASAGTPVNKTPKTNKASSRSAQTQELFAPSRPLRGMTVSCPTYGPVWGTPLMSATLADLKSLGVDWGQHPPLRSGQ